MNSAIPRVSLELSGKPFRDGVTQRWKVNRELREASCVQRRDVSVASNAFAIQLCRNCKAACQEFRRFEDQAWAMMVSPRHSESAHVGDNTYHT